MPSARVDWTADQRVSLSATVEEPRTYRPDPVAYFTIRVEHDPPTCNINTDRPLTLWRRIAKTLSASFQHIVMEIWKNRIYGDNGTAELAQTVFAFATGPLLRTAAKHVGNHPERADHLRYIARELRIASVALTLGCEYVLQADRRIFAAHMVAAGKCRAMPNKSCRRMLARNRSTVESLAGKRAIYRE